MNTESKITNEAVRNMIRPWLSGNDERDAKSLGRTFRMIRLTRDQWRKAIDETRESA